MEHSHDVVIEHRRVDDLFRAFTDGDLAVVPTLCAAIEEHLHSVEGEVIPLVDTPQEGMLARALRDDVRRMRDQIERVRRGDPSDHAFLAEVVRLMMLEREHVAREEAAVLGHGHG